MAKPMRSKTASGLAGLILFPGVMFVLLAPFFIGKALYPDTAIGTDGLESIRKYCIAFILSYVISALLIPFFFWLYELLYRAFTHEKMFSKKVWLVIDVIVMGLYILSAPHISQFELQSLHNGYSKFPLVHTAMLCSAISKDMNSTESIRTDNTMLELQVTNFQYRVRKSRRSYSTRAISNYEYGLYDKQDNLLGQITRKDYALLKEGVFTYIPHSVEIYPNSGLIKSIDGREYIEEEPLAIELVFDYDAGVLRRELLCEDEELLPDLYLWTQMDGRYAGGQRINGKTELCFKPMIPGKAEAWVELRIDGKAAVVVSNVISYDQTEYVDYMPFDDEWEE